MSPKGTIRDYAVVTGAYWVFTVTDGALRMLVLLFLNAQGFSPLEIASLFLFYEFFGVVTNLLGGYLGARHGLKVTLFLGLLLQIAACSLLAWQAAALTLPIAMVAQAISGIAKDLTKMSSKSYVKFVVAEDNQGGLMKWVALLTGSKNALKGVGFFVGGMLLKTLGFENANWGMAAALAAALLLTVMLLPGAMGKAGSKISLRALVSHDRNINWLSAARFFLFGSRDIWFVLALPIFLVDVLGWNHTETGAFLALWIIGYGIVQAGVPGVLFRGLGSTPQPAPVKWLTLALTLPLGGIILALQQGWPPGESLIVGLAVFGVVFAINSTLHSYLIIAFAEGDKVATKVGFYYMANAGGRLVGTVLSGALFQWGGEGREGLTLCLWGSIGFVVLSGLLSMNLRSPRGTLSP